MPHVGAAAATTDSSGSGERRIWKSVPALSSGRSSFVVPPATKKPGRFERDLIIERTQAGLTRARAQGKRLGRKPTLSDKDRTDVRAALAGGATVYALAKQYGTTRQTIMRVRGDA
jgi:Helix-turn-helix domain of resolvase